MVSTKLAFGAVLAAFAATGSAGQLKIKNHCSSTVNIRIAHGADCEKGQGGKCIKDGAKPYQIKKDGTTAFSWIGDGKGASVKIWKGDANQVLQFEYTVTKTGAYKGLYWDLSNIDGKGPGLAGTPFASDNVHAKPTGKGFGSGTCKAVKCKKNEICRDAYNKPEERKTRHCPVDTGDMWLALCQPDSQFNARSEGAEDDIEFVDLTFLEDPIDTTTPPIMPKIMLNYFLQQAELPTSPATVEAPVVTSPTTAEEPVVTKVGRAYYA
ncbi:hypothetical protein Micbo1qcDRAFT_207806 [Microdochium bolleyi]|uniref:Uncharacterized protein n=1 Tax=Microdochium bolleyi TaxID=196109 RepID=A0A136IT53_9PEZI|nr:hypothetical protein Micbo1qcDRAFT_207806 [Microdochium bolleyi]